jgi:hypothetical protein
MVKLLLLKILKSDNYRFIRITGMLMKVNLCAGGRPDTEVNKFKTVKTFFQVVSSCFCSGTGLA